MLRKKIQSRVNASFTLGPGTAPKAGTSPEDGQYIPVVKVRFETKADAENLFEKNIPYNIRYNDFSKQYEVNLGPGRLAILGIDYEKAVGSLKA